MHQVEVNGAGRPVSGAPVVASTMELQDQLATAGVRVNLKVRNERVFAAGVAALAGSDGRLNVVDAAVMSAASQQGLVSSVHLPGEAFASETLSELRDMLALLPEATELVVDVRRASALRSVLSARTTRAPVYAWQPAAAGLNTWCPGSPNKPAMAAGVRSRCPLLAAESANTVLPVSGLSAPAHSAWLCLAVDLVRFADRRGRLCDRSLKRALDACIEVGDALLEQLSWISPVQAADARKNRRLAISVDGLGDLVVMANDDPTSLTCLYRLDRLVANIHQHLWRRSRELARQVGALPALTEHQPSADWRDDVHRKAWADRWHEALQSAQVRHRNLLVLSPHSLLPRAGRSDGGFADLLPVLAHADALRFSGPARFKGWQAPDIKAFLDRLCAQVRRFNATAFIATGA